jgi:hypothetical protein
MPLTRPFIPSISRWADSFDNPYQRLYVPKSVRGDLDWYQHIVFNTPSTMPLKRLEPVDISWYWDASTSFGVAAHIGPYFAVWRWTTRALHLLEQREQKLVLHINWAEAVAVELGLALLATLSDRRATALGNASGLSSALRKYLLF